MSPQQITNDRDRSRVFPTAAMAQKNMTEAEGTFTEKVTGPPASGTVELSYPALQVLHVLSFVTATGAWSAVPNLTEGVDFSVNLRNGNGKCALTELKATNYSTATWLVTYRRDMPDAVPGNQSYAIRGS